MCLLSDSSWVSNNNNNNITLLVPLSSWLPSWFIVSYFCNIHTLSEHLERRVRCRAARHSGAPCSHTRWSSLPVTKHHGDLFAGPFFKGRLQEPCLVRASLGAWCGMRLSVAWRAYAVGGTSSSDQSGSAGSHHAALLGPDSTEIPVPLSLSLP